MRTIRNGQKLLHSRNRNPIYTILEIVQCKKAAIESKMKQETIAVSIKHKSLIPQQRLIHVIHAFLKAVNRHN
jgi:hypothetical protein